MEIVVYNRAILLFTSDSEAVRPLAARRTTSCVRKDARLRTASVRRLGLRVMMMVGLAEVAAGLILLAALLVLATLVGLGWLAAQPRWVLAARRDRPRRVLQKARPVPGASGAT